MKTSELALPVHATAAQQQVLDRIAVQRERLRARRAARLQSQALAAVAGTEDADATLLTRAIAFARQHPAAVAALAGVAIATGPRRLIRWAGVVLPLVMRLRR
ncbi:hypothetical protein [Acidovorax carolinensis]|uniref:hypothetical protein n=1 Tax=Acidovorax carolinensis TaxID=553814 RepID=UPI000B346316|nr:hypothetical protein [Acidovorax carolinensis]ART48446.1 hypothetical protein CBP33_10135 [Acidovorax carolinensis]